MTKNASPGSLSLIFAGVVLLAACPPGEEPRSDAKNFERDGSICDATYTKCLDACSAEARVGDEAQTEPKAGPSDCRVACQNELNRCQSRDAADG